MSEALRQNCAGAFAQDNCRVSFSNMLNMIDPNQQLSQRVINTQLRLSTVGAKQHQARRLHATKPRAQVGVAARLPRMCTKGCLQQHEKRAASATSAAQAARRPRRCSCYDALKTGGRLPRAALHTGVSTLCAPGPLDTVLQPPAWSFVEVPRSNQKRQCGVLFAAHIS
jgi:hypothetical protein